MLGWLQHCLINQQCLKSIQIYVIKYIEATVQIRLSLHASIMGMFDSNAEEFIERERGLHLAIRI